MAMKFVGGPKHGEDVPDWACELSQLTIEGAAIRDPKDGTWRRPRERYTRHTWVNADGRRGRFLAAVDTSSAADIHAAARKLFAPFRPEHAGLGGSPRSRMVTDGGDCHAFANTQLEESEL